MLFAEVPLILKIFVYLFILYCVGDFEDGVYDMDDKYLSLGIN